MWVATELNNGIGLTDDEIKELVEMYQSGKYYNTEIADWFGITVAKVKTYLNIARERGYC